MDILGNNFLHDSQMPPIEVLVVRKAWQLLSTFGSEDIFIIGDSDPAACSDTEMYEYIETDNIYLGDEKNIVVMIDQVRVVEGEQLAQIGYVAIHLEEVNEWGDLSSSQQLIFRLETHKLGAGVFDGDPFDTEPVEELSDLLEILCFLGELEIVMWLQYAEESESRIKMLPESESDRKFRYMTNMEFDEQE